MEKPPPLDAGANRTRNLHNSPDKRSFLRLLALEWQDPSQGTYTSSLNRSNPETIQVQVAPVPAARIERAEEAVLLKGSFGGVSVTLPPSERALP
jgi:hypothetical protein